MHIMKKFSLIGAICLSLSLVIACGGETPDRSTQVQEDSIDRGANDTAGAGSDGSSGVTTDTAPAADTSAVAGAVTGGESATAAATGNGTNVVLTTTLGDIEIFLDAEKAPLSVANFLSYVDSGHYEGTIFHRVIAGFMVQGGGFDATMQQKPTQNPIQNEAANGLKNVKYSIAMARTGVVNSATTQFFINVADNAFLDHRDTSDRGFGYAVFGEVVAGKEVVDKIAATQTGAAGRFPKDVPVDAIIIESVRRK